jgi:hypothetical protein
VVNTAPTANLKPSETLEEVGKKIILVGSQHQPTTHRGVMDRNLGTPLIFGKFKFVYLLSSVL